MGPEGTPTRTRPAAGFAAIRSKSIGPEGPPTTTGRSRVTRGRAAAQRNRAGLCARCRIRLVPRARTQPVDCPGKSPPRARF
ncbi:DUF6053 domain-containing protein [Lysobacter enzymogenes]|uniref:DUF6053 domain-containing protein n=1 Tax=Lysobacter enzymogenes TaxID=69 RepID=UPI003D188F6D